MNESIFLCFISTIVYFFVIIFGCGRQCPRYSRQRTIKRARRNKITDTPGTAGSPANSSAFGRYSREKGIPPGKYQKLPPTGEPARIGGLTAKKRRPPYGIRHKDSKKIDISRLRSAGVPAPPASSALVYKNVFSPQNRIPPPAQPYPYEQIQKQESLDNHQIIKAFRKVGVTRFELATTRPPEEKFIFSDKSN